MCDWEIIDLDSYPLTPSPTPRQEEDTIGCKPVSIPKQESGDKLITDTVQNSIPAVSSVQGKGYYTVNVKPEVSQRPAKEYYTVGHSSVEQPKKGSVKTEVTRSLSSPAGPKPGPTTSNRRRRIRNRQPDHTHSDHRSKVVTEPPKKWLSDKLIPKDLSTADRERLQKLQKQGCKSLAALYSQLYDPQGPLETELCQAQTAYRDSRRELVKLDDQLRRARQKCNELEDQSRAVEERLKARQAPILTRLADEKDLFDTRIHIILARHRVQKNKLNKILP